MRVKAGVPAAACGILFLIAACGDGIRTWAVYQPHPGVPEIFRSAAGGRDLHTVIYGNPTMAQGGLSLGRRRAPERDTASSWCLGGDRCLGAEAACQELDPAALSPMGERVELQAVFCFNKLRSIAGSRRQPGLHDDRRLNAAVTEAVLSVFPVRDPERRPRGKHMFEP